MTSHQFSFHSIIFDTISKIDQFQKSLGELAENFHPSFESYYALKYLFASSQALSENFQIPAFFKRLPNKFIAFQCFWIFFNFRAIFFVPPSKKANPLILLCRLPRRLTITPLAVAPAGIFPGDGLI